MITSLNQKEPKNVDSWHTHMRDAVTDPVLLWELLDLPENRIHEAISAKKLFPLKVPLGFIARMQKGDINDPLLRQVLPVGEEFGTPFDYFDDPVADLDNNPVPGIIHKYHGRVLLIASGACAVHCRYCFRRSFPYNQNIAARNEWAAALDYIKSETTLKEVILSGGDPLTLSNAKLSELFTQLNKIEHIKTVRLHSRLPVVLPERIDQGFLDLLQNNSKKIVMVIHANHPNELNHPVASACEKLKSINVHLLNQSVLLKDINDSSKVLEDLSNSLFNIGITPYYLNLLDKVKGAAHFNVCKTRALQIHSDLKNCLPGYLVPKLVRDIPGKLAKTWI